MDSYTCHLDNRSILGPNSPSHPVSHLFSETSAGDCFNHSKADSAYSSISGSSILPDFLPFLPDEFQAQSLTYMDLKFMKAKNNLPSFELDSKGIYHLYNSIQTITQNQERTRISNMESLAHMPPLPSSPPHARVHSSVSARNLDNSRAHQNPEGQFYEFPSLCYSSNTESYADLHCDRRPFQQHQNNHLPSGAETNILEAASPLDSLERSPHEVDHSYETDWIRSDSAPSPGQQSLSSCSNTHDVINESVQNKGHFFFVTGVIKPKEYDHVSMETSSELPYHADLGRRSCPGDGNGKLFFQEQYKPNCNHFPNNIVEHHNVSATNTQGDREQRTMSRDCSRHHSITHPIFYPGPENGSAGTTLCPALNKEKQISHSMASKFINKVLKTQLDVTSEKISKEKTPLLYHLAGAYRASCASKFRNSQGGIKTVDGVKKDPKTVTNGQHSGCSEYLNTAASKNDCKFSDPKCETLDDSFKKYYKEKLKDAQCRVLKETSFKRRDLQLSDSQMFRQQSGKHLFAVPHKSPEAQQTGSNNPNVQYNNQATVSGINKDLSKKEESGMDAARPRNVAQPQVPRVRSRKRQMADLKKLSRSEPEKLHQLPDVPTHVACRSLGNECDNLLSGSHLSRVLSVQMFETSERLPATNFPKTTLKLLRQNALVEYMQRKTGQRVAGSQQLASHLSSDRVSVAEKLLAWSSRHKSSHLSSKKLHRPISVLDSTSRSVKDDLFVTSSTNCWPTARKSGSVESLLERPERPALFRARSTSTPHTFQAWKRCPDFQVALKQDVCSSVEAKQEPKECEDATRKMWPADAEGTEKAIECHKDENVASNLSTEMPGVPPALSSSEYTRSPEADDGTYSPHKEDGNKLAGEPLAVEELKDTENEAPGEVVQAFPRLHWEALVKEVVSADWTLARTFYPLSNRKTALMLMEQLLSEDSVLMEEHYKKKQEQRIDCTQMITHSSEMSIPPPSVKDQPVSNTNPITEMKLQLKEYLEEELKVLEAELKVLEEEEQENQQWSRHLEARVRSSCDPPQLQRYTQFLQDLERVLSLLLCLSARLARVQNALSAGFCDSDPEDRESLESRYRLLCRQRDDAKDLKENLDRRECLVSGFLCERLPAAQLSEYRRFLQAKASLLIRRKELEEKRRVAEERVDALLDSVSHRSYVPIASQCLSLCTRDKNVVGGLF